MGNTVQQQFCMSCGSKLLGNAKFCPACGAKVSVGESPASDGSPKSFKFEEKLTSDIATTGTRKVGGGLFFGILFFPYLFSWFTLRKGHSGAARVFAFGWLAFLAYRFISIPGMHSTVSNGASPVPTVSPRDEVAQKLKLKFTWYKGGFDNVMTADFHFDNPTAHAIRDLEVTCQSTAASGTVIDSNKRIIYETIPAKGKKTIHNFNMGFINTQTRRTGCAVTDFTLIN